MSEDIPLTSKFGAQGVASTPVISVRVGYPWSKRDDGALSPARSDERWRSIAKSVLSVGEWVKTSVSHRMPAPAPFDFQVSRLRGSHGQMLLENLRERIRNADVLIMDIGSSDGAGLNQNVLLETGMAIAYGAERLRDIFILKPTKVKEPSDLTGFLFTDYSVIDGSSAIKIVDAHGFHAALRGLVLRIAKERQMIGPRLESSVENEDEQLLKPADSMGQNLRPEDGSPSFKARSRKGRIRK